MKSEENNINEYEFNINCLIIVEADKPHNFNYKISSVDFKAITFRKLINLIYNEFKVKLSSNLRVFNFYGIEILDDSDLYIFLEKDSNNRIVYFTTTNKTSNRLLLNCFELKDKLGEGGFGKVYLARQIFSNKIFAIKFINISNRCVFCFRGYIGFCDDIFLFL